MEGFIIFLIIVVGAFAWIRLSGADSHLRAQVADLKRQLDRAKERTGNLENKLAQFIAQQKCGEVEAPKAEAAHNAAAPIEPLVVKAPLAVVEPYTSKAAPPPLPTSIPERAPAPTPAPVFQQPKSPVQPPLFKMSEPPVKHSSFSIEETLGKNWLNKLGVALVVIAIAWFLAWKLQTMGPAGKIFVGYATSLTLLFGGLWLERKQTYRIIAAAGIGGGWALTYFTTFAMYHLSAARVIQSLALDLVLMLLVAGGMVVHSLRYKSQTVTSLAFLLAYATLLTSHLESQVAFSLITSAILAVALVAITTRLHWARLELAGIWAVYLTHFLWLTRMIPDGDAHKFTQFWPSTILILLYWLIFRVAYVVDKHDSPERHLTAVANVIGVLALLKFQSVHPEWAWWALGALGAIEFSLGWSMRKSRRTGFVILTTIGILLLIAAVPFKFHGFSWPILWLMESHVLAIAGLRLGEPLFRRFGLLAGIATGIVIAAFQVVPLAFYRLDYADPARHWQLTIALGLAALLYWIHAELYPRRWPALNENSALGVYLGLAEWEQFALPITSFLGMGAAATALWVVLPDYWVAVGWLALSLVVAQIAQRLKSQILAVQADSATACAIFATIAWNFSRGGDWKYLLPVGISIALLYLCSLRKVDRGVAQTVFASIHTWVAAIGILTVIELAMFAHGSNENGRWSEHLWLAVAVILFELGRWLKRNDFVLQGLTIGLAGGVTAWVRSLDLPSLPQAGFTTDFYLLLAHLHLQHALVLLIPLLWICARATLSASSSTLYKILGSLHGILVLLVLMSWPVAASMSSLVDYTLLGGLWLWISCYWAVLAVGAIALAALLRKALLAPVAYAVAAAVITRSWTIDFAFTAPIGWRYDALFRSSLAAFILLCGLYFCYKLRRELRDQDKRHFAQLPLIAGPQQWFFFTAYLLQITAFAWLLHAAHITIGWSVLGLAVFVFALVIGERSFRLGGLALLLLSVLKIILMDVWQLEMNDRILTLVILGLALIGVSFLYTRFSEQIRKLL